MPSFSKNTKTTPGFLIKRFWRGLKKFANNHSELAIILVILVITTIAHAWNMFNFPTLWDDEGFYISQSWAVANSGNLSFYTYWYDHTPAGWLFLALWNILASKLMVYIPYGSALLQGRVFIILLNAFSSVFVYLISRKITTRRSVSFVATMFFCISPLAIFFHRQVFLDNIMVFWFLLSLYLLIRKQTLTLSHALTSALAFGVGVLSKETAVVFLPVILFVLIRKSRWQNKFFVISTWVATFGLVMSLYPLYALLKGEFFPYGSLLGGTDAHVSLIQSISYQFNRKGEFFLYTGSKFQEAFFDLWFTLDRVFIILGGIATIFNLLFFRKHPWALYFAAFSIFYTIYLVRSIALDFYVIPLIPILVFNIAICLDRLVNLIEHYMEGTKFKPFISGIFQFAASLLIFVNLFIQLYGNSYIFTSDQNINHFQGIAWAEQNIGKDSIIVTDMSAFADMNSGIKSIKDTNVHSFWAAAFDPAIRDNVLGKNWQNIDYLLVNKAFLANSAGSYNQTGQGIGIVDDALNHARVIKNYDQNTNSNERLANGNFQIMEVQNKDRILKNSWDYYKTHFIRNGRVIDPLFDPTSPNLQATTSEAQSYALLRSIWMNDQGTFDQVLSWMLKNISRKEDSLFSWKYGNNEANLPGVLDANNASDGDTDTALALVMAAKLWGQNRYSNYAKDMIHDLYNENIRVSNGLDYYLPLTNEKTKKGSFLMNPSYFSPAHFAIFAENDPTHDWNKVINDGYTILNKLSTANPDNHPSGLTGDKSLPPNFFVVNDSNGQYESAKDSKLDSNEYSYDAFRTFWRVALDSKWNNSTQAKAYLKIYEDYFSKVWTTNRNFSAINDLGGTPQINYGKPSVDTGALSVFWGLDNDLQYEVYLKQIEYKMTDHQYWSNKDDYYDQNWGWFATAMYSNNLTKPSEIKPN